MIREAQELSSMEMLKNDEIDLMFGHISLDIVNFHFEEMCEEKLMPIIPKNPMPKVAWNAQTKHFWIRTAPAARS